MTKHRIHASPAIIGLVAAIAVVMTSTIVTPAFAIKFFFNCMTDKANEHGKLTLDDVHICVYTRNMACITRFHMALSSIHPVAAVAAKPSLS